MENIDQIEKQIEEKIQSIKEIDKIYPQKLSLLKELQTQIEQIKNKYTPIEIFSEISKKKLEQYELVPSTFWTHFFRTKFRRS